MMDDVDTGRFARVLLAALLAAAACGCKGRREEPSRPAESRPAAGDRQPSTAPATQPMSRPAPGVMAPEALRPETPKPSEAEQKKLEAARAAVQRLRADVQTRRDKARTTQAYREAFGIWDQAGRQDRAAAEAFDKGDFDAATKLWSDAAAGYDRAAQFVAAVQKARQHLASAQFPEATAAVVSALAVDAAGPAALQLQEDVRVAAGQKAMQAEKARVETAVAAIAGLSDAHGFAPLLQGVQQQLRRANNLLAANQFQEAAEAYKAVSAECERLKALDVLRQGIEPLRAQVEASRTKAVGLAAIREAAADWQKAQDSEDAGAAAMSQGDFEAAKKHWTAAQAAYEQAARMAGALQAARQQLAARQYVEAQKATQAVLTADAANVAGKALLAEIGAARAREAAVPLQAAAQTAVTAIATLDDGQGFYELKAAVMAKKLSAEGLFARERFDEAAKAFTTVAAECERLKTLDVARQALAKTRAAVLTQRQNALTAQARRLAPGRWQQAEAGNAAGEQAFQKGDFETPKTAWAAAGPGYDAATAAAGSLATARQLLGQSNFAEATKAAQAALTADAKSDAAVELLKDIQTAADRAASLPTRTGAEAAVNALAALDDGQGFGALKRQAASKLRATAAMFDRNRFTDAVAAYKALTTECERLKTLDGVRQATATARTQVLARRQEAWTAEWQRVAPQRWQQAQKEWAAGEQAFQKGDFDEAGKQWKAAQAGYARSAADAAAAGRLLAARQEWLTARGRIAAESEAMLAQAGGAKWAAIQALVAKGDDARNPADERAASYKQAAAQFPGVRAEVVAALLQQAAEAVKAKKADVAAAAGVSAVRVDPANAAAQKVLEDVDAAVGQAAVAPLKARAEATAAAVAALNDAQGFNALKAGVAAQLNAGKTLLDQKHAGQALANYLYVLADGDRVRSLDARRQETAKLREQAAAARQKALAAGAQQDATVPWQQGEAASGAAEQAFQSGDFDAATARWTDAQWAFDAAAGAAGHVADGRRKFQAKDFTAALQAALAATAADGACEAARKLAGEIHLAAGGEAALPARTQAEAAVKDLAALNDAQGFSPLKQVVLQQIQQAAEAFGKNAFDDAVAKYEAVTAACEKLKALDARRAETAKAQVQLAARQQDARKAEADKMAPTIWQQAEGANAAGQQAFERGAFDEASAQWSDATAAYARAVELADAVRKSQALPAAGKGAEAMLAARSVLAADAGSAAAAQAVQAIDLAIRRAAAEPLQKRAVEALNAVAGVADTEGFAALKQAAQQLRATADGHFAANRFEQAAEGYDATVPACERMKELDARRKATVPLKAQADAAVAKVNALTDSHGFQTAKQFAQQQHQAGAGGFEQRRFDDADLYYRAFASLAERLLKRDALRQELDGVRTQLDARVAKAQAAGVNQQAPEFWQRSEQARSVGLQAFQRGDFQTARQHWSFAQGVIDQAEALLALFAKAQQELAAGKLDDALKTVTTARAGASDNAYAAQQEVAVRYAVRRRDTEPLRRRAEQAAAEVAKVAGAQGVEPMKQQVQQKLTDAAQRFDRNEFDPAVQVCADVIVECEEIRRIDERRARSLPLREKAAATVNQIGSLTDSHGFSTIKNQARQQFTSAETLFEQRQFDQADAPYQAALAECEKLGRLEVRRNETGVLRQEAETAVNAVGGISDAQNFGTLKNQVRNELNQANALRDQGKFDEAAVQYKAVGAECVRLKDLDALRNEMTKVQAQLKAQRDRAVAAEISKYAPKRWKEMEDALTAGEQAYNQGEIAKAKGQWEPLLKKYAEAIPMAEGLKAIYYEGAQVWEQAMARIPKEHLPYMDRFGGKEWADVQAIVSRAENDSVVREERIGSYMRAASLLPVVAAKVEDAYNELMCNQAVAEAGALLTGIPARATERTAEHVAKAQKALDAANRALTFRPTDPAGMEVREQAKVLAVPLKTGSCLRTMGGQKGWLLSVAMHPAGDKALTGGEGGAVKRWDLLRGTETGAWSEHKGGVNAVAFSPDGQTALSAGDDATLKLWDLGGGRCLRSLEGHAGCVTAVAMAPDGKAALSAGQDGTLRLWDLAAGACVRTFTGHSGSVAAVAFSPDGKTALSGGADRTVRLWNVADGRCLRTFEGHAGPVTAVAFSPDGRSAVSAGGDKTLKLWDLSDGRCLQTFTGHEGGVECVAFNPDGRRVLSGSRDETLKLWDVSDGHPLATFEGHRGWVRSVAFSADGQTAVSVDETALKLWFVAKAEPPAAK